MTWTKLKSNALCFRGNKVSSRGRKSHMQSTACNTLEQNLPLFCKKGTTHIISILQENQDGGSVLHTVKALRGRISHTYIGYS
jgi:hypothetical protein